MGNVTITYESLTDILNALSDDAATAEAIINQAINKLNTYGAGLDNISGDEGGMTGTYTSAQAGAIIDVAIAVYSHSYVSSGAESSSMALGPASMSQSTSSSTGAGQINEMARELAHALISNAIYTT